MKAPVFAALLLSACLASAVDGQVKSVAAANNPTANITPTPATATRARVLEADNNQNKELNNHSAISRMRRTVSADKEPGRDVNGSIAGHSALRPTGVNAQATSTGNPPSPTAPINPTQVYRVGVGDVLDIQLAENPRPGSTLFTVLDHGVLDYPLAGNPLVVSGFTTEEIASLLSSKLKFLDNPKVNVSVRDYASHKVNVSGFVSSGGTKILRREAVPLYTLLAEVSVLPEAARATIVRDKKDPIVVDLKDTNLTSTLVLNGDTIRISGAPPAPAEFYFIGGEINSPGQKPFHNGLTLTQAILASGGTKSTSGVRLKISRQGPDGKLATAEFNLRRIQAGKEADPVIQNGDRIELSSNN